jgi:carbon-monoxide dehydrogenase large subunit
MTTRIFGSGIRRREDPRLITGDATYTDDVQLPGMVHAAILRSPHAHAKIISIDITEASGAPGVVAVYTGADTDGVLNPIPCAWLPPDCDIKAVDHPAIAKDVVRYQGDAVAVVVAEDRYQAEDALELINVEYEVLPSVVNPEAAMQPGAPQIHEDAPNNQAFHWVAAGGDTDAAFADADVIVKDTILQQRLIPNAMEPRSAVANWTRSMGELTLWSTSQNPHIVRFLGSLVTGIPEHKIRVIATEVGGGFGSKIPMYADEMITSFCSMRLNRPVKWTATRSEGFLATIHGRDHVEHVELAATREGKITGIRSVVYAGMGAYLSTAGPGVPTILHGLIYSGPYDIGATRADIYGVFSNTTPVDAYRGAGRPEATFLIERLIDLLAVELGTDPVELRRKNLIPKFEDGHDVASGITYDSGDYEPLLNMVLGHVDYQALRQEQARMRERGAYMGIGVTCYAEICGLGPSQVAGAVGFGGGLWESAIVRFHPTGKVNVYIGTAPHGQGEETTFAQIIADELGVDVDDVGVIHGDTSNTPMGWGTYGSRTTAVGGAALALAARKVKEKARLLAAHLLEAAEADVEYDDGKFFVKGSPDQSKTIQEIATMANVAWNMPEGMEPGLEASAFYDPPNFVYPFGTHLAVVEVDIDNGNIVIKRYVAGDDCGPQINPMIVEGQIHGGVVQGWGQALWEGVVYDDNGQLLTGSMTDYALPRAHMFPDMEILSTVTPSPHNPLGVKGIGETGAIASTVTVYNAVIDALRPLGVTHLDMPLTPEKVWKAIRQGQGS